MVTVCRMQQASACIPDHQDALVQLLRALPQWVLALLLHATSASAPALEQCYGSTLLCAARLANHLVEAPLLWVKGWWEVEAISPCCRQGRHTGSPLLAVLACSLSAACQLCQCWVAASRPAWLPDRLRRAAAALALPLLLKVPCWQCLDPAGKGSAVRLTEQQLSWTKAATRPAV